METVFSPVTQQPAELLKVISRSAIIDIYKQELNIDVSAYFKDVPEIFLYQCSQTGFRFFYPYHIAGDGTFYELLQKYDWYYADWKWDYDAALPFIEDGSNVLDIGCGYGNFLHRLKKDKNCTCTGLEFNDKAVEIGISRGINMFKDPIETFASANKNTFDYVCFFQVLEHVSNIDSFMKAAIESLKSGGKMLICVPNNNPYFYRHFELHSLNMPPHHMGWWNEESFKKLTDIYPIDVHAVIKEKLTRYRFYTKHAIANIGAGNSLKKVALMLLYPFMLVSNIFRRKNIDAGSILMVYKKR